MMRTTLDQLVSLCKRRGFVYPSSDIYGGLASAWDYGPLGVQLKNNLRDRWWRTMTRGELPVVGLDAAILMHPRVWEASGHASAFNDPLVDCRNCKARFRADHLEAPDGACPQCGKRELTEARQFNMMMRTTLGPVEDGGTDVFLRPETAQGAYVNFKNVVQSGRVKVPFGIAQVGKAFRNEITTKSFIFRTCEFEQMEMQFFVHPSQDERWFEHWREARYRYYTDLGIQPSRLRLRPHGPDEIAHYAKVAVDIEYDFPSGWQELEGIHNRTDFDLRRHAELSRKDLTYLDDGSSGGAQGERFVPYVIETAVGLTRTVLAVLADAYDEEEVEGEKRTVLRFHPAIAPITVGVFPLVKKDGLAELAREVAADLRADHDIFYDQGGAIGRRYRRQDEIGTPYCVTIDHRTRDDGTVTVRLRDSMEQMRVPGDALRGQLAELTAGYSRMDGP
jgi:glycyl-tRNA synthetase